MAPPAPSAPSAQRTICTVEHAEGIALLADIHDLQAIIDCFFTHCAENGLVANPDKRKVVLLGTPLA